MGRASALAVLVAPVGMLLAAPPPTESLQAVSAPGTAPLVGLVALAAWTCTGWLLLVAGMTLVARGPGRLAGVARRALPALAPASVRGVTALALGVTVASGALGAGAAAAAPAGHAAAGHTNPSPAARAGLTGPTLPGPPLPGTVAAAPTLGDVRAPRATPSSLDWPTLPPPPARVPTPSGRTRPATPSEATPRRAHRDAVVVRPGDCLWSLAEQALGPAATPARTADLWPRWWAANRSVIGDDPDLLRPGTRLTPPA